MVMDISMGRGRETMGPSRGRARVLLLRRVPTVPQARRGRLSVFHRSESQFGTSAASPSSRTRRQPLGRSSPRSRPRRRRPRMSLVVARFESRCGQPFLRNKFVPTNSYLSQTYPIFARLSESLVELGPGNTSADARETTPANSWRMTRRRLIHVAIRVDVPANCKSASAPEGRHFTLRSRM